MTKLATVNYHVHKPERQAFELDANGIIGNLISPELAVTQVQVFDERVAHVATTFEEASVGFAIVPSQIKTFDDSNDWQPTYDEELVKLLSDEIGAQEVIVFDHTVRIDEPDAVRKPARN